MFPIGARRNILLTLILLIGMVATIESNAGWFGPDNYEECMEYYLDKVQNINAHTAMAVGCKAKFVEKYEQYGQCHLNYLEEIKSSYGFLLLNVACVQVHYDEIKEDYNEISNSIGRSAAECMLGYIEKVVDKDSALFFSNVKCGASLSIRTTTTNE